MQTERTMVGHVLLRGAVINAEADARVAEMLARFLRLCLRHIGWLSCCRKASQASSSSCGPSVKCGSLLSHLCCWCATSVGVRASRVVLSTGDVDGKVK